MSSEELKMTSHQVESTARETVMSREDPFRYVALLVFLAKERTLSWMKKQSETFKLCPRGMILCLSLVWPVTFHRALPSFTELDHAACPQRICFMDALEFVSADSKQPAVVPQCCTGKQLDRQTGILEGFSGAGNTLPAALRRAAECRCFAAGWFQLAIQCEGRSRIMDKEEAARRWRASP